MKAAAVIGAGIGGIAVALRLAARGYLVDVFEKEAHAGGKLAELRRDGFRFDLGPSLFTQPERVEELFRLFGEEPSAHFRYSRLPMVCRYLWPDGTQLDAPSSAEEFVRECRRVFGGDGDAVREYLQAAGHLYNLAAPMFLDRPFPTREALMSEEGRRIGKNPFVLDPFVSLHRRNSGAFSDPRLVQLFDRYATYNGSDPYQAPATLKMIAHLEHNQGAFFPERGMYSITEELTALAVRHGVRFHMNTPVSRVTLSSDGRRTTGISAGGQDLGYPLVISDTDVHTLYRSGMLVSKPPLPGRGQALSTSAMIYYWGVKGSHNQLDLHNILFSGNYREEFRHLFRRGRMFGDPTVYIFISSKVVPDDAPIGYENWFVMVNAPENTGQDWDKVMNETRKVVVEKIGTMTGISLEDKIVTGHHENPLTIQTRTGSWHGSLYGNSSNSRMSAFMRHPNHRNRIKGLYFTGGSVHPGGGIPLCLASAKIVADLIENG